MNTQTPRLQTSRLIYTLNSWLIAPLLAMLTLLSTQASCPPAATTYSITLNPGLNFVASHLSTAQPEDFISSLNPVAGSTPFTVYKYNETSLSFDQWMLDPDAGWFPGMTPMGVGSGAVIDNSGQSPVVINPVGTGLAVAPIFYAQPGLHLLGAQRVGTGTFESILGRPPTAFSTAAIYRYNPTGPFSFLNYSYDVYIFANGMWSPSAPLLAVGESAFLRLGNDNGGLLQPYTASGISPSVGSDGDASFLLRVAGTGFGAADTITLRKNGGNCPTDCQTIIPSLVDGCGFDMEGLFDLTLMAGQNGYYDVLVQQNGTGPVATLLNAFYLNTANAGLEVNIVGNNVAGVGMPTTYILRVKNVGGTLSGVGIELEGTAVGALVLNPLTTPLTTILNTGFTDTIPTMINNAIQTYTFTVTPDPSLLNQTVVLKGKITAPLGQETAVSFPVQVLASADPNHKSGPLGVGTEHFVEGLAPFDYQITFENEPTAGAPARNVVVSDPLDPTRVDLNTLELGPITFGSKTVVPPSGSKTFNADVAYDVDGIPGTTADNIVVRINVTFDTVLSSPTFGRVQWSFQSLDATTLLPISNASIGFLPHNQLPPEGQGSVSFRVQPFANLASGDVVTNGASIVFDANAALVTPVWSNTVDKAPPASQVQALAAVQTTPSFLVSWAGSDAGSGIASYDIYVSDNNGSATKWLGASTATSATFTGQGNHTYAFYSIAVDKLGHVEAAPAVPDASTTVQMDSYQFTLQPGLNFIGVNLKVGGNTVAELFPEGSLLGDIAIYKFNGIGFVQNSYNPDAGWNDPFMVLNPGDAAFVDYQGTLPLTVTEVGTPAGPVVRPLVSGTYYMVSSLVNGPGTIENILGAPPGRCQKIELQRFHPSAPGCGSYHGNDFNLDPCYDHYNLLPGSGWSPSEPILAVGEGCWIKVTDCACGTIVCPSNIVVQAALNETNAVVTYSVGLSANVPPPLSLVCTPASGSTFPTGVTSVTCVGIESCGVTNTCSFTVTVTAQPRRGDLFVRDTPYDYTGAPDEGGEPDANMVGQNMWTSSAIWVHDNLTQADGTFLSHQNPRYGQDNRVFAEVKNIGGLPVNNAELEIWFANASLGLSWPEGWTRIGSVTLPSMAAGASHIAHLDWRPDGTGHYCLLARIVSTDDPMTFPEESNISTNVRKNNNLAWRNVNVADCLHQIADKVEVRVHNVAHTNKLITLVCKAGEDFVTTGGEVLLDLGPLHQRWLDAGGHGVNVVSTGGTQVRCTGSPARLEDIPFKRGEEHIFNLTVRARKPMPVPGTSHVYHVGLIQEVDGEAVGGVNYGVVCRALHTDSDGDGILDVDDPDNDNDGVPDDEDETPLGPRDCLPASLTIRRVSATQSVVTWSGLSYRLQSTSDLDTPWHHVAGAVSPYTVEMSDPQQFYRLVCP